MQYTPPAPLAKLLERRLLLLLGKRTLDTLRGFMDGTHVMDDLTLAAIQEVLTKRWHQVVIEYKELDRVQNELRQWDVKLTGFHAQRDQHDPYRVNITPGLQVITNVAPGLTK